MSKLKIAIITGASSGIGKECALLFISEGYKVINISRSKSNLKGVVDIQFDLSRKDQKQIQDLVIPHIFKSHMLIVHNAFSYFKDSAFSPDLEKLEMAVNCGIRAPMTINELVLPFMEPGSCVAYIGSTLSFKATKGNLTYTTLKHAIIGMMKSTVQDAFGTGINSFCVCPGFTDTPMLDKHLSTEAKLDLAKRNSHNRLVRPVEIAQLILKLSNTPSVNGSIISADLGQYEE